jgi:hypothetical protein
MKEEIILKLVQIQNQFRFLHWQTYGDAKHRAYGETYEQLGGFLDEFAEITMGKYGRYQFDSEFSILFQDISKLTIQNFLDGITEFLVGLSDHLDSRYDTDLLNLRDEILGMTNKLKYLLTLKH